MFDAEGPHRRLHHPKQNHDHVPDVFLVDHHVHQKCENRDLGERRERGAKEIAEVKSELVVMVSLERLYDDAGHNHDQEQ